MQFEILAQSIISGVLFGGVLALIALGLTLIWGVMGVLNIAHAHFVVLAMFVGYFLVKFGGLHPYVTLPILILLFAVLGALIYQLAVKRAMRISLELALLFTIALLMFLEGIMTIIQAGGLKLSLLAVDPKYWIGTFKLGGIAIDIPAVIAFSASIALALLLFWFITKTDMGRNIRACSENPRVASLMAINVGRTQLISFGIGISCTAAAAALMLPTLAFDSVTAHTFMLTMFAIVALGGIGHFLGTLVAALIIGFAEGLAGVFIPGTMVPAVGLFILVIVLMVKPEGLFGTKTS